MSFKLFCTVSATILAVTCAYPSEESSSSACGTAGQICHDSTASGACCPGFVCTEWDPTLPKDQQKIREKKCREEPKCGLEGNICDDKASGGQCCSGLVCDVWDPSLPKEQQSIREQKCRFPSTNTCRSKDEFCISSAAPGTEGACCEGKGLKCQKYHPQIREEKCL